MPLILHWPKYFNDINRTPDGNLFIRKLLIHLNSPNLSLKNIIHITGTNGKGSTCEFLRSILTESRFKVGKYTSPHLHDITERISINGQNIPYNTLFEIIEEIRFVCEKIGEKINEFEATTIAAIIYFQRENCDFSIIEVGMGGLHDATNLFEKNQPIVSIITPIDLDHIKFLGSQLEEIAFQKAFIIQKNSICVSAKQKKEALEVIKARCDAVKTKLFVLEKDFWLENISSETFDLRFNKKINEFGEKITLRISKLKGFHQIENSAIAAMSAILIQNKLSGL